MAHPEKTCEGECGKQAGSSVERASDTHCMLLSGSTLAHERHWDVVSADKVVVGSKIDDAEGEEGVSVGQ